jgi:BlaI family penicillinase repressor
MPRAVQITDAEWDVMEPVWDAGEATAADVIKRLQATHEWNPSTIRTLLARLVEKGALRYEVDGARYIYRPAASRHECVRREGRSFLDKVFGGDVGALVAHFVEDAPLDDEQIRELRKLLDGKRTARRKKS